MTKILYRWVKNTDGATAIEYGLIVAFLAVAITGSVFAFGDSMVGVFTSLTGWIKGTP